ncbi:hypothetical protein pclt_cds_737 [Pandoravirus celtis]|uniref:Uncharacterized protein n=1 Tax=Pandoravirus celtis TaxID=2568002 RepID=A0A4D6EHX6_9VIRU|nr:hypothetical protein pclt_cds_737 [Pandoravirus celtis]
MQHDGSQQEWTVWDTNTIVGNDERSTWYTDVTGDNDDWRHASGVTIIVDQDKRLVEPHRQGDPHGVVRIHFSNGDTQAVRYEHGRYIDGVEFVCSSSCPVTEYAGRIFHCRWQPLSLPCWFLNHHLLVAADDSDHDSDDARPFGTMSPRAWSGGRTRCAGAPWRRCPIPFGPGPLPWKRAAMLNKRREGLFSISILIRKSLSGCWRRKREARPTRRCHYHFYDIV